MLCRLAVLAALCAMPVAAQDDPLALVTPLLRDGDAAYLKGDYDAASAAFAKAWDGAQAAAPDAPVRYQILKRLSSVRAAAGDFAAADGWLAQAVSWREAARGKDDPGIADDLLLSAAFQRGLKNYDRALDILHRVQGLHAAIYGPASPLYADDFTRMARIYAEQKQNVPAIAMHQIALGIRTRIAGPLDPALVPDLDRLGELYTIERQYEKAEDAYRHDLVIRETIYGKMHADLISTVDGLAYSLFGQKKYDAADPVYRRLLGLWEDSVGKDHPMVAVTLDKIAVFYAEQKKYPEARDMLARSSAIRARFHALGISQQATEAFAEGSPAEAKAFYRRALSVLGDADPANAGVRQQVAEILQALDDPAPKSPAPKPTAPPSGKP